MEETRITPDASQQDVGGLVCGFGFVAREGRHGEVFETVVVVV
jgi:hypothetical protein